MIDGLSSQLVVVGEEIWIYYSGFPTSHMDETTWPAEAEQGYPRYRPGGVGLAKLRRDGFVSIDGDDRGGVVTTKPFTIDGGQLYLNANAEKGEIQCELVDGMGDPIAGFRKEDCVPFSADGIRQAIAWKDNRVRPSAASPLRLRCHLKDAKLYSFWFE